VTFAYAFTKYLRLFGLRRIEWSGITRLFALYGTHTDGSTIVI
jgi:hypothetical protein